MWAAALCGCEVIPLKFEERKTQVDIKVITYPDKAALQVAHTKVHKHDTQPAAFYTTSEGMCTIHVLQMTDYNDFYDKACEWGHELTHCVYGTFHSADVYRGC